MNDGNSLPRTPSFFTISLYDLVRLARQTLEFYRLVWLVAPQRTCKRTEYHISHGAIQQVLIFHVDSMQDVMPRKADVDGGDWVMKSALTIPLSRESACIDRSDAILHDGKKVEVSRGTARVRGWDTGVVWAILLHVCSGSHLSVSGCFADS